MEDVRKAHKAHKSGAKANKKKTKVERHNPKAFTFSGGWKSVQKRVQRSAEISEKREKFERLPDKSPTLNQPPYIVVVQGPPQSGKSTLIRSLVKHYTKQSIGAISGPVTCVVSKSRRLTFVECPNEIGGMLDLAKVADLVITLIDSEKGLEMDTFEFINILQTHGFPRILGVLTKLDLFKDNKSLRKFKKNMKQRYWTEIYDGAKLFYLTGIKGKKYLKREVLNLSRFVAVQKFQPLTWKTQHPYLLPLSIQCEPFTSDRDVDNTRSVSFSGYVKGCRLRPGQALHLPGAGDYQITKLTTPEDPCPMPIVTKEKAESKDAAKLLRRLKQSDRIIYAPLCDVGTIAMEADSVYIKVDAKRTTFTPPSLLERKGHDSDGEGDGDATVASQGDKVREDSSSDGWSTSDSEDDRGDETGDEETEGDAEREETLTQSVRMVRELQMAEGALDKQVNESSIRLVKGGEQIVQDDQEELEREEMAKLLQADDELSEGESLDTDMLEFERDETLSTRLQQIDETILGQRRGVSLEDLVYNFDQVRDRDERQRHAHMMIDNGSAAQTAVRAEDIFVAEDADRDLIVPRDLLDSTLVTEDFLFAPLKQISTETQDEKELPVRDPQLKQHWTQRRLKALRSVCFITGGWESGPTIEEEAFLKLPNSLEEFDKQRFDERVEKLKKQKIEKDEAEELMAHFDDVPIGTFVRVTISGLPNDWVDQITKFDGSNPLILGGVLAGEKSLTYLNCKVKRHRWSPKIMKSSEVLLFSVGWRRFQSLPYFAIEDRNEVRHRYLKYTPEHMHCHAYFYGHAAPPGTGILAVKHMSKKLAAFRISMTGVILENVPEPKVMKKLKLIGEASEVKQNTAFIKNMFTTDLEVSKFVGARIQTQSNVKGIIKKARGTDGEFRATFEAKILKNDIVICKTWLKMPMEPFCNPMIDVANWDRLRTFVEIRQALRVAPVSRKESEYGIKEVRKPRGISKLRLPKHLLTSLPYKTVPKQMEAKSEAQRKADKLAAPVMSQYDKLVAGLINRAGAAKNARLESLEAKSKAKLAGRSKEAARVQALKDASHRQLTKRAHVKRGLSEKRSRKRLRLED